MPRIARAVATGFPHHVIQRGNNKEKVFFDKKDREQYLSLLRKYKRTGRLWESRYHSCIIDKEKYLWAVARYIEQNPTRARIVKKEEDFPYSSARAHIYNVKDEVLGEDLFEEGQRKDYRKFIRTGIPEEERNRIRYSTRTGRPFGSETFVKSMEKKLNRRFILKSPGRPRKKGK